MNIVDHARALLGRERMPPPRPLPAPLLTPRLPQRRTRLALALQGGGSFGAFTWGVLDGLLDAGVTPHAISGASAGAINGVLLASGLVEGGRDAAREKLAHFWRRVVDEASFLSLASMPGVFAAGPMGFLTRTMSPSQFNPFDLNPLRRILTSEVDFERLADPRSPKLLVATTRVKDGRLRIFRNDEITADVVLASACLPLIHHTVEIDGEAYWDGAYVANPPILQLVHEVDLTDLLIVQLTPEHDDRVPVSRTDIARRLDQINFNSALNAELAALELARRVHATEKLDALRITRIAAEDEMEGLVDRSAADLGRLFIDTLHSSGRNAAERWLTRDGAALSHVEPPKIRYENSAIA